jgi:hypothetical protein
MTDFEAANRPLWREKLLADQDGGSASDAQFPPARTADRILLNDPRFQSLLAKAETHQRKFRPKETAALEAAGRLMPVLEERAWTCWESLSAARKRGMTMLEAQEEAFPMILLPTEEDEFE